MTWFRKHMKFANVISAMALFIALGGTGYAAFKLPKNSVGTKQIKKKAVTGPKIRKNAVTSSKVKNGSLKRGDFAAGQLPAGERGPAGANGTNGATGAQGPQGEATGFARVQANGTLEPSTTPTAENRGVDGVSIQHAAAGIYCFGSLPFQIASAVVSADNATAGGATDTIASVAIQRGANLGGCDANHQQARVETFDASVPGNQDRRFYIWFEK